MNARDKSLRPSSWTSISGAKSSLAQSSAKDLLALLDHPDVLTALSGKKTRRDGHPYETYLLAAIDAQPIPKGRMILENLANGKPVETNETRELLLGINTELSKYLSSFKDLPKDARTTPDSVSDYYVLETPKDGATPRYYLQEVGYPNREKTYDEKNTSYYHPYLDEDQRKALEDNVGKAILCSRKLMGNAHSRGDL